MEVAELEGDKGISYRSDYLIQDSSQVLPLYVALFTVTPGVPSGPPVKMCESCHESAATVYCLADQAYFCDECDYETHAANKLLSKHVRVSKDDAPASYGRCHVHNMPIEFYDPISRVPVCVHCKMVGSHSTGEAATHKLITIAEAYKSAVDASLQVVSIVTVYHQLA